MTKAEAKAIDEAIAEIESGRVEAGLSSLRRAMTMSGFTPAPPMRVVARDRPARGKER
jgi:hypothetical protein